jgi:hypothetical protein
MAKPREEIIISLFSVGVIDPALIVRALVALDADWSELNPLVVESEFRAKT